MNKKILLGSIIASVFIILTSVSSTIGAISFENEDEELVTINTIYFHGIDIKEIETQVTKEEQKEIRTCLKDLINALDNDDKTTVSRCESFLKERGILGNNQKVLTQIDTFEKLLNKNHNLLYKNIQNGNNSEFLNMLCTLNMESDDERPIFLSDVVFDLIVFSAFISSIWLFILSLFIPFIRSLAALCFIVYAVFYEILLPIYDVILTNIPLRFHLPYFSSRVNEGNITTKGLNGFHSFKDNFEAEIRGFFGVMIHIKDSNPYWFLSGISLIARARKLSR